MRRIDRRHDARSSCDHAARLDSTPTASSIATGYATPYFKPLAGRFRMLNTYVVATRPLDAAERRAHRARRRDAVGHGAAVSLRALDAGSSAAARRRRSAARAGSAASAARSRAARASVRGDFDAALSGAGGRSPIDYAWEGLFADDAGRPALHRPAPPLSAPSVRARLRRQRHDVRLSRAAPAARLVPRRPLADHALFAFGFSCKLFRFPAVEFSDFSFQISSFKFSSSAAPSRSTSIVHSVSTAASAPTAASTGATTAPTTPTVNGNSATVRPSCSDDDAADVALVQHFFSPRRPAGRPRP